MLTIWFYKLSLNNVISLKDLGLMPISLHCMIHEAVRLSDLPFITQLTVSLTTHGYTVALWFTIFLEYFNVTTSRKISS